MRSFVLRRLSWGVVTGVVGISVELFPRVGVRGGASSGSEIEAEGGAASDGSIGVEVWRSKGGARARLRLDSEAQGLARGYRSL
jgi:hypothetical protein